MFQPSSMLCCISRKHRPSVHEYQCTLCTENPTTKWVSMYSVHWWTPYNQVGIHAPLLQTLHNEFSSPLHKNQHRCWEDVMLDGCKDFPPHFCKDFPLLSSHRFRTRPKIRTFSSVFGQNWIKPSIPCCKAIKRKSNFGTGTWNVSDPIVVY